MSINESATFESECAQKYKPEGYSLIATNESYWGWEYDTDYKYAFLYMNNIGNLILKIVHVHVKSGIGAGKVTNVLYEGNVGTINKPDIKTIQDNLKKFSHEKSSAGRPFSRNNWKPTFSDEKMLLSSLLKDPRTSRMFKAASVLEDEPSTEKPIPSGVRASKREKLALLHKYAYKLSEQDLDDLMLKLINSNK
jgi:hypothetical protein